MTLQKREKVLAIVVGVLLVVVAGRMVLRVVLSPLATRQAEVQALEAKAAKKKEQVEAALVAQTKLAEYRRRALPSDPQIARTAYQNWLLELADKVKLKRRKVDSSDGRELKGIYTNLPFTVRGEGTLEQLTQFLYEFYSAGHLHRIRRLSVKPIEKSSDLELTIVVEALSLPDADRRDQLASIPGQRLSRPDLGAYRKTIVERNLFAAYRPAPPAAPPERRVEPPKSDAFDPSKYAYVTAIVSGLDGQPRVWIKSRSNDENLRLRQGERFEIGPMKGTIARIGDRHVEIQLDGKTDGKPLVVALGDPLKSAE
ncbi:MAG: hypothetical protein NUV77_07555 [Thermoguttaceae bacterium]|jgi:Tfp pilus assembly protein PilO|nr:hypothetical protein [Thermoguttaceae bacterium]